MADTPRLDGRTGQVWTMTIQGMTQEAVAEKLGISQPRVSQIIAAVRASIPAQDKEALIIREVEFLDHIRVRAQELADMALPPAFDQKGGILWDPLTKEPVRDISGRVTALKLHLDIQRQLAKMVGLEAPTKTDVTITDQAAQAAAQAAAAATSRLHGE